MVEIINYLSLSIKGQYTSSYFYKTKHDGLIIWFILLRPAYGMSLVKDHAFTWNCDGKTHSIEVLRKRFCSYALEKRINAPFATIDNIKINDGESAWNYFYTAIYEKEKG